MRPSARRPPGRRRAEKMRHASRTFLMRPARGFPNLRHDSHLAIERDCDCRTSRRHEVWSESISNSRSCVGALWLRVRSLAAVRVAYCSACVPPPSPSAAYVALVSGLAAVVACVSGCVPCGPRPVPPRMGIAACPLRRLRPFPPFPPFLCLLCLLACSRSPKPICESAPNSLCSYLCL